MALYKRDRSPFWWMVLSAPGRPPVRVSTKIPAWAPTSYQRAELKQHAEAIYAAAQAAHVLGHAGLGAKPTITAAAYFDWYEQHVTRHKEGAPREREILATLRAHFGAGSLRSITRERVMEWRTARADDVSAATVNREIDVLKHLLAQAVPTYLDASPLLGLRRLRTVKTAEPVVLSRADEAKLLAVLAPKDRVLLIAALDTLMRAGDLLDLEWRHDHGTHLTVLNPKSGVTYKVPVSTRLRTALKAIRRRGRYIFAHRRKAQEARTRTNGLKQLLAYACTRAGVAYGRGAGVTWHALRHTGATRMLEAGVDLRTLQELGGWASLRMLTRYLHVTDARKAAAVEAVGVGVAGKTSPVHSHFRKIAKKTAKKRAQ